MERKPTTSVGYPSGLAVDARRMALHIATILGDLAGEIVIVGGLVPYLIIDQALVPEPHVGTRDLDLGLSIAVLNDERYRALSERLRDRGFEAAVNKRGNRQRQTWRLGNEGTTVDFLIPPAPNGPDPGSLQNLEEDFASPEHIGPKRRAEFLGDRNAPGLRQDAVGAVQRFLTLTRRGGR